MNRTLPFGIIAASCALGCAAAARADSVTLLPSQDNLLIESELGDLSNGAGQILAAGRTGQFTGSIRRGLIAFDFTAAVPSGSTITSVELTLHLWRSAFDGECDISLHRTLAAWGEGASNSDGMGGHGGGVVGAPSEPGDATWLHRFYDTDFWTTPGGDFSGVASATLAVGLDSVYVWGSTAELVADVQGWVDDPAANFGWVIVGDESTPVTAKAFYTREDPVPEERPTLTIVFTPPVPCPGDVDGNLMVDLIDLAVLLAHFGTPAGATLADGDLTGDGAVDLGDLAILLSNFGVVCA